MKLPYYEYPCDLESPLTDRLLQRNDNTDPAIVCEGRELSYREMNQIADTLAARLMAKGVQKGDIVAVDMCRSERYISSVYGVMRSGGCCLPMEHTWPEKRKQMILETAGAALCITEEDYALMLADGFCAPETRVACKPEDNALIIFTSGSTGVPKGIYRTHKDLGFMTGLPTYRQQVYPWLRQIKRAPAFITFATTAGISSFLIDHALGQTCWLLNEEESKSPRTVAQAILELGLQDLVVLPAFIRAGLQDEVFRSALHQLKDFRLAGGSLTQDLADELRAVCPQLRIWNAYGMTETGAIAAGYVGDDMKKIGKPVPNMLVTILDEKGQDAGVNEPGEICVGSAAMTKVYLNAPELNRQKYFVHPEYGPLFRTGDLGRGDEEGDLYVLGRLDRMVKIREVRIELDEIERTIAAFPGVKQGVSAVHGPDNDRFIVGYYLSDEPLDEEALRRHLLSLLPQSYLPRYLMRLETVPLTATGKVAYPQLPVPEAGDGVAYEAPGTQKERCLCQVLGDVLKMPPEKVSMGAGFAQLGGDSVRAMIVCSRLREKGWVLQPNVLYGEPTLGQAARRMEAVAENGKSAARRAVRGIPREEARGILQAAGGEEKVEAILHMSFESRSMYELLRQKGAAASNISSLIPVNRGISEEQFRRRAQALVSNHPALRSRIMETELGAAYQVVLREKEPSCYYRDLRYLAEGGELPNEKQRAFCTMYMNFYASNACSFEEAISPHFVCFRFGDEVSGIGFSCSHVFLDGWSSGILMKELAAADDPKEKDSYIDYMELHAGQSKGEDLRFWREYLKGVQADRQILTMKREWEEGAIQTRRIFLDETLSHEMEQYAKAQRLSPTVLLQYLTGRILCEVLDREEVVLMVFFAARGADVPREEGIVGNLARLYPVRYKAGQPLAGFHGDLRQAEGHMAPTIGEIFAACGLWIHPVLLTLTTSDLPGSETLRQNKLFASPRTYVSPDTLDAAMLCTPGRFGVQLVYNPLIFPEEKMEQAEGRLRDFARQLLQEA